MFSLNEMSTTSRVTIISFLQIRGLFFSLRSPILPTGNTQAKSVPINVRSSVFGINNTIRWKVWPRMYTLYQYSCIVVFLNESIVRNSPTVSHNLLTMGQLAWIFLVLINTSNYIIFFMCLRCTSYGILHNMRKCTCINNNSFYKYILCLENFNIMSKICS